MKAKGVYAFSVEQNEKAVKSPSQINRKQQDKT